MNTKLIAMCALITVSGCMKQQPPPDPALTAQRDIEQLFDRWRTAFEARDLNGVMSVYAPGARLVAYDLVPPLQFRGAEAYRKDYSEIFAQFDGPLRVEFPQVKVEAGADTAFAYGLEHMTGTLKDGTPVDLWWRYTGGLKYVNDHWVIVHEHVSVPVDMATGKARMDLKP